LPFKVVLGLLFLDEWKEVREAYRESCHPRVLCVAVLCWIAGKISP